MEKCTKCGGVMLLMKTKKSVMPDAEKKQGWKCSRCGQYVEKQQIFNSNHYQADEEPYYIRRRSS